MTARFMTETISRECGNIDVKPSKSSTHLTDSRDILHLLRQQRNTVCDCSRETWHSLRDQNQQICRYSRDLNITHLSPFPSPRGHFFNIQKKYFEPLKSWFLNWAELELFGPKAVFSKSFSMNVLRF